MTHPDLPPIGVIGLPTLAQHCVDLGLPVLTADEPEGAAVAILEVVQTRGPIPVIAADTIVDRVRPWLGVIAETTPVVLTTHDGALDMPAEPMRPLVVPLPASVADILAVAGIAGLPETAATLTVLDPAPTADPASDLASGGADLPESASAESDGSEAELAGPVAEVPQRRPDRFRNVVICWSGKGGVGKSTFSLGLAQAAANQGLRVALIDANFGQGDLRTFLRIGTAGLPSVYQAATGAVESAFIDPDVLNTSRSVKLEPVNFTVVQAPPVHVADSAEITPELYMKVVEYASDNFDLVVLDTQIVEAVDRTGMVDRFVVPILLSGARGLAVTDSSGPSISNLLTRLKVFGALGVPAASQLAAVNRIPRIAETDITGLAGVLADHATFVGAVFSDDAIPDATNRGRPIAQLPQLTSVLDIALAHALDRPAAATSAPVAQPSNGQSNSRPDAAPAAAAPVTASPSPDVPAAADQPRRRRLFGRHR